MDPPRSSLPVLRASTETRSPEGKNRQGIPFAVIQHGRKEGSHREVHTRLAILDPVHPPRYPPKLSNKRVTTSRHQNRNTSLVELMRRVEGGWKEGRRKHRGYTEKQKAKTILLALEG